MATVFVVWARNRVERIWYKLAPEHWSLSEAQAALSRFLAKPENVKRVLSGVVLPKGHDPELPPLVPPGG